ncbi:hypothetical protein BASA81_018121 [Batrachochytrium salamandrivorans]|nr:hypothetical protein BASA81_018121 [Batrachochytrium salamandrivorans]
MVDVIRLDHLCVMHQHAHSLPRHVWTDRQQWPTTLSFAHPFEQRLKDNPCSSCSNHIPPSLSRSNRSNCYIKLLGCASRRPVQTLRDEWSRLKAAATQLERVDGRKQWVKHADNLDRAVSDGRTDLVFAAARAMSGNSSRSAAVTPLYNSNGIVQYDPNIHPGVMQCHYGSLQPTPQVTRWTCNTGMIVSLFKPPNTPTIRNSNILDQDFSWNQIAAALLQMSSRKAPGDDGITTAFYQAALYMPANTQEGVPPTPFARALLRVCGQVFASATIPRAWLCASIVSIDKKDGDPLNPGDKRGIALINVGLKLVCKVLQMRIERFVETNNLLSYEQAGSASAKSVLDKLSHLSTSFSADRMLG